MDNELIIVSNRVPLNITRRKGKTYHKKSVGGLVTALDPILAKRGGKWIGWDGHINGDSGTKKIQIKEKNTDKGYDIEFMSLSSRQVSQYYHGFSNRSIWPLFHGFILNSFFKADYWKRYLEVNKKFADIVVKKANGNSTICVQDYHLMLLPELIRKAKKVTRLLFFLHIPFPNYEIFRVLPWDKKILNGLLGCDMVGFQTSHDVENFLGSCEKILNAEVDYENRIVKTYRKKTSVNNFPISIDYNKFSKVASRKSTKNSAKKIKKDANGCKIILSIERLDYTKGIRERLLSIERFFEKYPSNKKKVTFLQISVPSRTKVQEYISFKKEIDELVGYINGKFSEGMWTPINYLYRTLAQNKLISYYLASDVCLVTPLRDGMNLIAKEYVSSKIDLSGVLVLSEFAGAAEEMKEHAVLVNPYDIEEVADGLNIALKMGEREKSIRIALLQKMVKENDIYNWAERFINYLD